MKRNKSVYLFFCFFLFTCCSCAQQPAKLKFAKDGRLSFFQVGSKHDTLYKSQNNTFYLLVPDSLKEHLSIQVENGQFQVTGNDSIVQLNHIDNLKYESFYQRKETPEFGKERPRGYDLKTLINGTSSLENEKIQVKFIDKKSGRVLLENNFFYKEK